MAIFGRVVTFLLFKQRFWDEVVLPRTLSYNKEHIEYPWKPTFLFMN